MLRSLEEERFLLDPKMRKHGEQMVLREGHNLNPKMRKSHGQLK